MKILLMAVMLCSAPFFSIAQIADSTAGSTKKCFEEYKAEFAKRGVNELKDGLYNIIITIRLDGVCTAYEGRARVEAGKFVLPIYIKQNGDYVTLKSTGRKLNEHYDAYKIPLENKVVKGCSPTYISDRNELVDFFLVDLLKAE